MPTAKLIRPLFDYLDHHCQDHANECPLGACVRAEPTTLRRALTVVSEGDGPPQRLVRDRRCQSCTLVLLLQAMERNVGSHQMLAWMDSPLIDLKGRTPRECLDTLDYDPLIDAIWLLDQNEQTCG